MISFKDRRFQKVNFKLPLQTNYRCIIVFEIYPGKTKAQRRHYISGFYCYFLPDFVKATKLQEKQNDAAYLNKII